ncbi:MAG: acyl-CoA dehydrogenase family protein [Planctomycetes bacterium]|nr:acyl-CoA dehydrogenase family protein [Planctomycetota bacterium]
MSTSTPTQTPSSPAGSGAPGPTARPSIPKDAGRETLELVEASRETEWQHPSFVAELFMGRFRPELLFPYPEPKPEDRAQCSELHAQLAAYLRAHVDADAIDEQGEMPLEVIRGLQEAGFFSLKIPREYGGLGVSQSTYGRLMELVGSHCGSTGVWLSAHQSIGVPTPLKLFGTKEQKQRFLPRLVKQDLSGFALTEPNVGSDPGDMQTIAVPAPDGDGWILNGEKLWCTNGTIADVLVVMARTPSVFEGGREKKQITAFLVETSAPGVEVEHRCQFVGLRGLANGQLRFRNVRIPKENVLWGVGKGLKLALITLNTGRLTLPATCSGTIKQALRMAREWASSRKQWGLAIGRHEAIGEKIAAMATDAFAVDAVSWLASGLVDRGGTDIRIEAAMAKLFGSERAVQAVDHAMQIRGGRGYETYASQQARGQELAEPLERLYRDVRINTIVEGSSEIMRLFLAREALDERCARRGHAHRPAREARREAEGSGPLGPFLRALVSRALVLVAPVEDPRRARRRALGAPALRRARLAALGARDLPSHAALRPRAGAPPDRPRPRGRHRHRALRDDGLRLQGAQPGRRCRARSAGEGAGRCFLPPREAARRGALPRPREQRRRSSAQLGPRGSGRAPRVARGRHPRSRARPLFASRLSGGARRLASAWPAAVQGCGYPVMNSPRPLVLSCALLLVLGSACSGPTVAPPLAIFRSDTDPEHYLGSPLSGPRPASEANQSFRLEDAWLVELRWRPLRAIPEILGMPLGSATRGILAGEGDEEPVTAKRVSDLLRRARFDLRSDLGALEDELIRGAGAAPDTERLVRAALLPGTTALCGIAWDVSEHAGEPRSERLQLAIGRASESSSPRASLAVRARTIESTEIVFLDRGPELDGPAAVLYLPSPLASDAGSGIAVSVRVHPAPDPASALRADHHRAFADALADYERGRKRREYWSQELVPPTSVDAHRDASVALSSHGMTEADASFLLARSLGCPLAVDLVLALDEESQQQLRAGMRRELQKAREGAASAEFAWILESTAVRAVLEIGLRGPLPPAVMAAAARRLGTVSLSFAMIEDLLATCRTMAQLEAFLLEENRESLEDASLEARILALHFLSERGRAPRGYDPLAEAEQRREQLEKARAEGWQ